MSDSSDLQKPHTPQTLVQPVNIRSNTEWMVSICQAEASAQGKEAKEAFWNVLQEDQMPLALHLHPTTHTLLAL